MCVRMHIHTREEGKPYLGAWVKHEARIAGGEKGREKVKNKSPAAESIYERVNSGTQISSSSKICVN